MGLRRESRARRSRSATRLIRLIRPAVAGLTLIALLVVAACGSTRSVNVIRPSYASEPPILVLHWMSFSHHQEPRNQLLFEGGEPDSFTELRVLAADGTPVATGIPAPSATQVMRMCGGDPKPGGTREYGALRVTINLASQQQLHDFIAATERHRVEVLAGGVWQPTRLVVECHAME